MMSRNCGGSDDGAGCVTSGVPTCGIVPDGWGGVGVASTHLQSIMITNQRLTFRIYVGGNSGDFHLIQQEGCTLTSSLVKSNTVTIFYTFMVWT